MVFFYKIYRVVSTLFRAIYILFSVRVLLSWINIGPNSAIFRFVYQMTEPILYPIRELLRKIGLGGGMLDFSIVFAALIMEIILDILRRFIVW